MTVGYTGQCCDLYCRTNFGMTMSVLRPGSHEELAGMDCGGDVRTGIKREQRGRHNKGIVGVGVQMGESLGPWEAKRWAHRREFLNAPDSDSDPYPFLPVDDDIQWHTILRVPSRPKTKRDLVHTRWLCKIAEAAFSAWLGTSREEDLQEFSTWRRTPPSFCPLLMSSYPLLSIPFLVDFVSFEERRSLFVRSALK